MENQKRQKKRQVKKRNPAKKKYIAILAVLAIVMIAVVCILVSKAGKDNTDKENRPPTVISTEGLSEDLDNNGQSEGVASLKPKPVDKTNLESLIDNAAVIDVSSYTQVSVDVLNAAVTEGKAVLADETAERVQIEEACKKLLDAIQGLEKQQIRYGELMESRGLYEKRFQQRVAQLRKNKGISARDMSLSLGQNSGYINHIEKQQALPSLTVFFNMCEYFGITPVQFFDSDLKNPELIEKIMIDLKKLDKKQLQCLSTIIHDMAMQMLKYDKKVRVSLLWILQQ